MDWFETWHRNRTLVIAWLVYFFPVGLWGLWASDRFAHTHKIIITVVTAVGVLLIAAVPYLNILYLLIAWPAVLVLVWRDRELTQIPRLGFAGASALALLIFVAGLAGGGYSSGDGAGMARTIEGGGCTYFRDSSGNVIGRQC